MKPRRPSAPSQRPFEDALLDALLAVHEELQSAPGTGTGRPHSPARILGNGPDGGAGPHPMPLRPGHDPTSHWPGTDRRGRRRALIGAAGISTAILAGALAFSTLRGPGERVTTVVPGAQIGVPLAPTIFVANWGGTDITAYPLPSSGNVPSTTTLSNQVVQPQGIAIDSSGNLWVANTGSISEYTRTQLTKSSPVPVIYPLSGGTYAGLAFDSSGDLWVDVYGSNTVVEYTKSQLAKPGPPRPRVTISGSDLSRPFGLAFDRAGNLWVGNENTGQVLEYSKPQLTRSGSPRPTADLSAGGNAEEVAFDSSGDLWVATWNSNSVVEFTKDQLTNVSPSPAVTITSSSNGGPVGLAFDPAGDLWVANYNSGNAVVEYSKPQLDKSGSPTPLRTLATTDINEPVALAVEP